MCDRSYKEFIYECLQVLSLFKLFSITNDSISLGLPLWGFIRNFKVPLEPYSLVMFLIVARLLLNKDAPFRQTWFIPSFTKQDLLISLHSASFHLNNNCVFTAFMVFIIICGDLSNVVCLLAFMGFALLM